MSKKITYLICVLAMFGLTYNAYSAVQYWDTTGDHMWSTAGNWQNGAVPTTGSIIIGASDQCVVNSAVTGSVANIYAGHSYRPTGTCNLNIVAGGSIAFSGTSSVVLGSSSNGYNATLNITGGGTLNVSGSGGYLKVGDVSGSTGTLNMSGTNSYAIANNCALGYSSGGNGMATISDGAVLEVIGSPVIGRFGSGTMIVNGGTVISQGWSQFFLGSTATGSGTLTINSGLVDVVWGPIWVGSLGAGIVNVNGGTLNTTGVLNLGGGTAGYGIVNLEGGSLNASSIVMTSNSSMNITEGTLKLTGEITDITNYGNIMAYSGDGTFNYDYDGTFTTITAEIPEPATICLLGFGGMVFLRRFKK
ncbi:MAG: hypothetical protein A2Y10_10265 [Planctomycetes bacterium GWF2_41_51]|nr:MAG: hypothetical protein A2Y10_10265 [Planctomycetes bacterium GWF2_41_51]